MKAKRSTRSHGLTPEHSARVKSANSSRERERRVKQRSTERQGAEECLRSRCAQLARAVRERSAAASSLSSPHRLAATHILLLLHCATTRKLALNRALSSPLPSLFALPAFTSLHVPCPLLCALCSTLLHITRAEHRGRGRGRGRTRDRSFALTTLTLTLRAAAGSERDLCTRALTAYNRTLNTHCTVASRDKQLMLMLMLMLETRDRSTRRQ